MAAEPLQKPLRLAAVVLAGGQGLRMGGADKGLVPWQGQALVDWMLQALRAQEGVRWQALAISANRNLSDYAQRGLPLLQDDLAHRAQGPLAGMLQALRFAKQAGCDAVWLLPCDTPLLPPDLAQRLVQGLLSQNAPAIAPAFEQAEGPPRWQAAHVLLRTELAPALQTLFDQGERRLQAALRHLGAQPLLLPPEQAGGFGNFNALADLQESTPAR
ncbi:molybdopterin-guanine dinucleotide biosynthesis protein A [Inhella inkyongensis]|uniref:Molybdenum cofactor guanylyltransferase n=1 Tax=Inhella inkyongensis TaxID=392593 RepID=A0A840S1C6_9BURK|nr:NTP transferase domain-containing protein [Inhella inkyongensis]MBB5203563.1 molybdopterin-guanine dinucleotide biosynthesis protein A [Inhella inkyongensis]